MEFALLAALSVVGTVEWGQSERMGPRRGVL